MTSQDPLQNQAALELMARLRDPKWALEAARIEDEANCNMSAGHDWGDLLGQFMADPDGFHQYSRLQTFVLNQLRQLLTNYELGARLGAAHVLGKNLLMQRLQQPSPEVQTQLKTVLEENSAKDSIDVPLSATAQATLNQVLRSVLTPDDWETISAAAATAIQQHIRHTLTLPKTA
ncbi:MAG: hypothetical protein AAGF01_00630 [Cyanobacteria bacterium P01_G01_bin.38]